MFQAHPYIWGFIEMIRCAYIDYRLLLLFFLWITLTYVVVFFSLFAKWVKWTGNQWNDWPHKNICHQWLIQKSSNVTWKSVMWCDFLPCPSWCSSADHCARNRKSLHWCIDLSPIYTKSSKTLKTGYLTVRSRFRVALPTPVVTLG